MRKRGIPSTEDGDVPCDSAQAFCCSCAEFFFQTASRSMRPQSPSPSVLSGPLACTVRISRNCSGRDWMKPSTRGGAETSCNGSISSRDLKEPVRFLGALFSRTYRQWPSRLPTAKSRQVLGLLRLQNRAVYASNGVRVIAGDKVRHRHQLPSICVTSSTTDSHTSESSDIRLLVFIVKSPPRNVVLRSDSMTSRRGWSR